MTQERSLKRSISERVIAGVCGGIAAYLKIDPVVVRLVFVLLVLLGGGGLLAYIILWIVLPEDKPWLAASGQQQNQSNATAEETAGTADDPVIIETKFDWNTDKTGKKRSKGQLITGLILIGLGILFLSAALLPDFSVGDFWPVLIIILGIIILTPAFKSKIS